MGTFDNIHVSDERFVCSEGHSLVDEEFQSKCFGATMGDVQIVGNQIIMEDGGWGDGAPKRPLLGRFYIYCTCSRCPAFVQAETFNVTGVSCEFELEVVDDVIRSVKNISPTTAEFLVAEPKERWMHQCRGPMSYEDARKRKVDRKFFPWDPTPAVDAETAAEQQKWRDEIDDMNAKFAAKRGRK